MSQPVWNALINKVSALINKVLALINKVLALSNKVLALINKVLALGIVAATALALAVPFFLNDRAYAQFDPHEIERAYQAQDYAKVDAIAEARLQIDPYDVCARYYLASALLKRKKGGQALLQYEACAKCGGNSNLAQMARKAIVALRIDERKASPQFFERAKVAPKEATANGADAKTAGSGSGSGSGANSSEEDVDASTREAIALLRKDLADAIEVKRRRQSQDLELVAEEENQAIQEAIGSFSLHRDEIIEAARMEATAKRTKV
jgi:hypothetical protein